MIVTLKKEFRFEASHQLPNHDGKCARLHGHSWKLVVEIQGNVKLTLGDPKEGMVIDYADIKTAMAPIIEKLDHHHLGSGCVETDDGVKSLIGDDPTFPSVPTSENMLIWIAKELEKTGFAWYALSLDETCTSSARLEREQNVG